MDLLAESITEVAVSGEIANTDRVLNIAYGIDRNFLFGAAVSMQSVVMHNPDLAVKFHLFTDYIDEDYLQRVNAFTSKNANAEVRIYKVSNAFIDIFPSLKQWSYATFFRLVAFQYLSETIENLLYIDADVICKGSLAGLLDINFDGDKFAAVIKDVPFMQEKPAKRLAIEGLPGNYFNAGVVYLQLEAWAKNDFMNKAIAMLASDPQHTTKLIHYVGVTKPWNDWTNYPCQKYFNEAYQASCWNDVAFIPATNEKQYQVKYQHAKKNGDTFNAFIYFIKFKLNKYKRKLFG